MKTTNKNLLTLIEDVAVIPSFSYREEILFAYLESYLNEIPNTNIIHIPHTNSIIVEVAGKINTKPIALCCHLDKIDHWYNHNNRKLKFQINEKGIVRGQLDNSVGVGLCLFLANWAQSENTPPLYLLFSDLEECGMLGAKSISEYIIQNDMMSPSIFITIDVCPRVPNNKGVALYTNNFDPDDQIKSFFLGTSKKLFISEGFTDYLIYGRYFSNTLSIAIEPAINNIHSIGEECHIEDINKTCEMIQSFLTKNQTTKG